ncbi:MAG: hypothetical protein Unbinned4294contig1001_3 [Prokaryotic dsDNA virus sp.]|jgi:hypothetical protein|nr:MAG: hypothetical protein Unbinned4294contig1001_3 [Prokaryotic dsDNA virus sp.]|tara:strand:+ start:1746 stop:1982 length:237 start_codon:yes stop_codon:yes gene_type:complete
MINIQTSKYPFNEGDEYYTFGKDGEPVLSVWDDESKAIHDADPVQTYYFVFGQALWKKKLRFFRPACPEDNQYAYSML